MADNSYDEINIEALEELPECGWSESVALDPKHRPQTLDKPATTVRREWLRWPQEAHLLDEKNNRYRRLTVNEIALIQGFDPEWVNIPEIPDKYKIAALGNAVPPPLSTAIFKTINKHWQWNKKTCVEICSGIGGLACGAASIPEMKHIALIEHWGPACEIARFEKPWPPASVIQTDVSVFDFSQFHNELGLLCGGPPCQPWSQAGHQRGELDERDLLGHLPTIVASAEPEVFVIENVPGLATNQQNAAYLEDLINRLSRPSKGPRYGIAVGILNAADYGVPQIRRRLFIIGFKGKSFTFAQGVFNAIVQNSTHADPDHPLPEKKTWLTLRHAFNGLVDPGGWRKFIDVSKKDNVVAKENNTPDIKTIISEPTAEYLQDTLKQHNSILLDNEDDANSKCTDEDPKQITMSWPGKSKEIIIDGDKWKTVSVKSEVIELSPLDSIDKKGSEIPNVRVILGDPTVALDALNRFYASSIRLAYMDSPRIDSFNATETGYSNSIWMTLLRNSALRIRKLLQRDGVIVVQSDDETYHYARMVLEEVFGPNNYVATFVWQKKYGPQNDSDIPTDAQDYMIAYANEKATLPIIGLPADNEELVDDNDPRGPWRAGHKGARSGSEELKFEVNCPPYRWELVSGSLPPGIWRVSPQLGVLWAEKLTKQGVYKFKIKVSDSVGNEDEANFKITVKNSGVAEHNSEVWWLNPSVSFTKGKLRMISESLPNGLIGSPYRCILKADGGIPFKGKNKKPGHGRYWEFSPNTLKREILNDNVWFGSNGTALPSVKKHHPKGSQPRIIRELTWWPYELVGKSEDATKHLQQLADDGLIQSVPRIGKPESLMKRLVRLFTHNQNDFVLSIFDPTASMPATAMKLLRRSIHLPGSTSSEIRNWEKCGFPRLIAASNGKDQGGISKDQDVNWDGGAFVACYEFGTPIIKAIPSRDIYDVNLKDYKENNFVRAICSVAGFWPIESKIISGVREDGSCCIVIPLRVCLTKMHIARIASEIAPHYKTVTVLYERTDLPESYTLAENVFLLRIPFDLVN